jgi:tetratricopeptide (TPR) repeat protein
MAEKSLEQGHRDARDHYLDGAFDEARRCWELVLAMDPEDSRAKEGVRLCEILLGEALESPDGEQRNTGNVVMADGTNASGPIEEKLTLAKSMLAVGNTEESARLSCEILELDPDHDEAGRLLEQSTASLVAETELDEGLSVLDLPTPPTMDPAACATNPGIETLSDDPNLHRALGRQAEPDRQGKGLDFGDLDKTEALSLAGEVPTDEPRRGIDGIAQLGQAIEEAQEIENLEESFDLDFAVGDLDDEEFVPTPPEVDPEVMAGEGEVSVRIEELLSEARAAEADDALDDALARVERALILAPDHKGALGLRFELEKTKRSQAPEILDRIDKARRLADEGELEKAEKQYQIVLEKIPGHALALEGLAELTQPPVEPETEATDAEIFAVESLAFPDGVMESPKHATSAVNDGLQSDQETPRDDLVPAASHETPSVPSRETVESGLSLGDRVRALPKGVMIGAGAVAILLLGWGGWQMFGAGSPGEPTSPAPVIESTPTTKAPAAKVNATQESTPAGQGESAPESVSSMPATLSASLDAAMTAEENGNWEQAILLYNHALQLDPGNMPAVKGMAAAAASFEESRRLEGVWDNVKNSFETGAYEEALRTIYRMPQTNDADRLARATAAGWYNLAVTSLRAGDPQTAIEHLDEALNVQPTDAGLQRTRDLAESFLNVEKTSRYYRRIESLVHRDVNGVSAENVSPR